MMKVYTYDSIEISPDLGGLYVAFQAQASPTGMALFVSCRWDEDIERLDVRFSDELPTSDKQVLDAIVRGYY